VAFAQVAQAKLGWLSVTARREVYERYRSWFLNQMLRHGWSEGRNLVLEVRGGVTDTPLAAAAAELMAMKPDVLIASGTTAVKLLSDLTKEIPIVMLGAADPVGSGFAASLARPGGNITGVSTVQDDLRRKVLGLIHEWVPSARRIDGLVDAANPVNARASRIIGEAARSFGLTYQAIAVRSPEELEPAIAGTRADALMVASDPMFFPHLERIAAAAIRRRLPTLMSGGGGRWGAAAGLLCSYDVNMEELVRRTADCAVRILRGAKPADIPIEQPTRYEYVINLKTARAIGVVVPKGHLTRADEVIE
jgi:putative ABC transport system substrate-binding protein